MKRLILEIASETTGTTLLGVAACDESESETRMTPEKLKPGDVLFQSPDHERALELTLSRQRRPSSPRMILP